MWRKHLDMNRAVVLAVTIFYFLACCGRAYGDPILMESAQSSDDRYDPDYEKRASPGGMWFGPRLGKRSRDMVFDHTSIPLQRMLIEAMAANSDYGSKRRLTPRLGRDSSEQEKTNSKIVDFIPRLGRELSPSLLKALVYYDNELYNSNVYGRAVGDDRVPTLTEARVPPFAPRLGRELTLNDIYNNARVERSTETDAGKSSKSTKPKGF